MASVLDILLRAKGGDAAGAEIGKVNKSASESTKIFNALGSMLSVGILAKGLKDSIAAYGVQQEAVTKLNSALRTQGIYSETLSKKLQDQASSLQSITTFGDEAIISNQAFAMSMGLSADTVSKITPLVLDFASAMNIDLQAAWKVVGQAASGNVGTLKSYGIVVDEAALKNDGFNAVLDVMQKNFKGTAEAVAKSGIGPMKQFKNTLGDLQEVVGETLIPGLNSLLGVIVKLGKNVTGTNEETENMMKFEKRVGETIKDTNVPFNIRLTLMQAIKDGNKSLQKEIMDGIKKETTANNIRVEQSQAWIDRLKKEKEAEAKASEERVKKIKESEKEEYDTRRELGELNLQQILTNLEKEIEATEEGSEKRKALELAVTEYKHALRLEDVARIAEVQDAITSNLQTNLSDMLLGEKNFGEGVEGVWENLKQTITDTIVKTVIEEKAAATIRIAAEQAVIAAKAISAYAGIPVVGLVLGVAAVAAMISEVNKHSFQSGGVVPGAEGVPVQATVHGGEEIITPQQKRSGAGKSISIQGIYIQFPNVTTFSDWMNASPALVKQVTERKILQALSTLEDEGKIKEGTVLI